MLLFYIQSPVLLLFNYFSAHGGIFLLFLVNYL